MFPAHAEAVSSLRGVNPIYASVFKRLKPVLAGGIKASFLALAVIKLFDHDAQFMTQF